MKKTKKRVTFYTDARGFTKVRNARYALEKQAKILKNLKSRSPILRDNTQALANMDDAIQRSKKIRGEGFELLKFTKIERQKIKGKQYWVIRNPASQKIEDKVLARGDMSNKYDAWQKFNKSARKFDANRNILFATDIGLSQKVRGKRVVQVITKTPDRERFGKRNQVQFKADAVVHLMPNFRKKHKIKELYLRFSKFEGYSTNNAKLSQVEKESRAKKSWHNKIFTAIKRRYQLGDVDLTYEDIEIVSTNKVTHNMYYDLK